MSLAVLSIGSNLGDRAAHLASAVTRLGSHARVRVTATSRWHETAPAGCGPGQAPFLNAALLVETSLDPLSLLDWTQEVERQGGRRRDEVWGARTIDVDMVLMDDLALCTPRLELPHPRCAYRRFMIEPAAEIAPDWIHPHLGWPLRRLDEFLRNAPRYVVILGGTDEEREALVRRVRQRVPLKWLRGDERLTRATARRWLAEAAESAESAEGAWLASEFWWNGLPVDEAPAAPPLIPKLVVQLDASNRSEVEACWRSAVEAGESGPRLELRARDAARHVDELVGALQSLD